MGCRIVKETNGAAFLNMLKTKNQLLIYKKEVIMAGPGAYWIGKEGNEKDQKFLHKVSTLEKEFARYCGANYALATSSGTSALLVSLFSLGLKPGDEVIVPAYTFVATYSACIFAGLVPVLAEIDESLSLDPDDIERRITSRTKAIIPVHMLGNPCNMDRIMAIARKHHLMVPGCRRFL